MLTKEDLAAFLDRLDAGSAETEELEPGLWLVRTQAGAEILVHYAPPVVVLRIWVMPLPAGPGRQAELCRRLLSYNATDLIHGAYGLEGDRVVLVDTLELENLEFSEFEASFDSLTLALATHLGALAPYRE
jgi:CesT_Tir_1